MRLKYLLLTGFFFHIYFLGLGQSFQKFDSLLGKADSAYNAKNYSSSAEYYEQAIHLHEDQKPEIFGGIYYTIARIYSLNHEKEKALNYLEKSFLTYNAKNKTNPVDASEITSNSELNFIRDDGRFKGILNKYYAKFDIDFAVAKEVSYKMVLNYIDKISTAERNWIEVKNKTIYWKKLDDIKYADSVAYNEIELPLMKVKNANVTRIIFTNCTFRLNLILGESPKDIEFYGIEFINCRFYGRCSIMGLRVQNYFSFRKCQFSTMLQMGAYINPQDGWHYEFVIDSCTLKFVFMNLWSEKPIEINVTNNFVSDSSRISLNYHNASEVIILNNSFKHSLISAFCQDVDVLKISGNKFRDIFLRSTNIKSTFEFENNELSSKLIFEKSHFPPDATSNVEWSQLNNLHLGLYKEGLGGWNIETNTGAVSFHPSKVPFKVISGEQPEDISNSKDFDKLMGIYSMFLSLYKSNNNNELYNSCFIQIKELQSKRLKYLYESHKAFETYFRWKLSQLLKYYVRHGTDPARAIVISLYIIFWFGVFYFFFPSDWDTTSKKRLIENFKDFVQKNEKGYVKPFFVLMAGFALSLVNALTLSLNAFITRGFGNIPTHGLARYVCVIEGFMGWFLLSIFTVALINQVI